MTMLIGLSLYSLSKCCTEKQFLLSPPKQCTTTEKTGNPCGYEYNQLCRQKLSNSSNTAERPINDMILSPKA